MVTTVNNANNNNYLQTFEFRATLHFRSIYFSYTLLYSKLYYYQILYSYVFCVQNQSKKKISGAGRNLKTIGDDRGKVLVGETPKENFFF